MGCYLQTEHKMDDELKLFFQENFPQIYQNKQNLLHNLQQHQIRTFDDLVINTECQQLIFNPEQLKIFEQLRIDRENKILALNFQPSQLSPNGMQFGLDNYTYTLNYQQQFTQGKRILVVGLQQSGKTCFINAMANAILGVKYPDSFRYHIAYNDFNEILQPCNIMEDGQTNIQFLEVQGYNQSIELNNQYGQSNHTIFVETYNYLQQNGIQIDYIIFCRRNGNRILEESEIQLLQHLAEIFDNLFARKLLFINTNFDFGVVANDRLIQGLQQIQIINMQTLFELIPQPQIIQINSLTTPLEGVQGNVRYESVIQAWNQIQNRLTQQQQTNIILDLRLIEGFQHRRQLQERMRHNLSILQDRLNIILPYIKNYFNITPIQAEDDTFITEHIEWYRIQGTQYERIQIESVENILQQQPDPPRAIQIDIDNEISNMRIEGPNDYIIRQQINRRQFLVNRYKLAELKTFYFNNKQERINEIINVAQEYVNFRQEYYSEQFLQREQNYQQIIRRSLPQDLLLYLQQEQTYNGALQDEFLQLREDFFLPADNLQATDILINTRPLDFM